MPMKTSHRRRNSGREQGAVALLAIAGIVLLIILGGYMVSISRMTALRAELQKVADAASHAGATTLCGTVACWNASLKSAGAVVNAEVGALGWAQLDLLNMEEGPEWELGGYVLAIERGRITPISGFESLTDEWQETYPGIPRTLAANAVRVRIDAKQPTLLAGSFLGAEQGVSVVSTAASGSIDKVCVAPFAVSACALLNDVGEMEQANLCRSDRIFRKVNEYSHCYQVPAGDGTFIEECSNVPPAFPWYPYAQEEGAQAVPHPGLSTPLYEQQTAGWEAPALFQIVGDPQGDASDLDFRDNYGIVGLPEGGGGSSEELVQVLLGSGNGCVDASLGESFVPLSNGLTSEETAKLLWSRIRGVGSENSYEAINPSYSAVFAGASVLTNYCQMGGSLFSSYPPQYWLGCALLHRFTYTRTQMHRGMCNSARLQWLNTSSDQPQDETAQAFFGSPPQSCGIGAFSLNETQDLGGVWRVQIPVVADPKKGASSCQGVLGSLRDPDIPIGTNMQIIGFVDAHLFDLDIARPPPERPEFATCPLAHVEAQAGIESPPEGWGAAEPCNLVRGRISCDTTLVATSQTGGTHRPRLVE